MPAGPALLAVSLAYLLLLFGVAWYGDRRAEAGRSVIDNPTVYALSMAVYCTSWTFYGSVGRAAVGGVAFLPIYLGPTLASALSGVLLARMVRIAKRQRIASIADFIAARYGKSPLLGGIVTVIAVIGIMPYISLQLRAVSTTVTVLAPDLGSARLMLPMLGDTAALVAVVLAAFAILFGTRRIDAADRHEGVVLAVAFESVVKLAAFLAVGLFVTFALFEGPGDLFAKAGARADLRGLFTLPGGTGLVDWVALILLSFLMALCLPRQFQMTVVENVDERHVGQSAWRFPLYLFLINLFVLPIALAGRLIFDASVDPDTYVLALPLAGGRRALAVLAFLGGLSAAASMVIVETIALSTMVCNDLVMPVLLRLSWLGVARRSDVSALLVAIRRWTIAAMVLLGYLYVRLIGDAYPLTTIGLVSFCAAAQFAPALLGGMIWKGATRAGALAGLVSGFLVWLYTLFLPSLALSGVLPVVFAGGAGLGWARPDALFGLEGMSPITHALVWSLLANIGAFGLVSLLTRAGPLELIQAALFVAPDIGAAAGPRFTRGTAPVNELMAVVTRFLGREAADRAFADFAYSGPPDKASADLLVFAERLLAGAIGAASARVTIATVVKGERVGLDEVMKILDEASGAIAHSQQLEIKSRELEAATADLRAANRRLRDLDKLKDDFIATVTHELRTPLTSIRSFSEILRDNPDLKADERADFLTIVVTESERLTRLINQVLDIAKMEAGREGWSFEAADPKAVVEEAVRATSRLFGDKAIRLTLDLPADPPMIWTDRDKLIQVTINLLSNAAKFVAPNTGHVRVGLRTDEQGIRLTVADNGPGIPPADRDAVFEKFRQGGDTLTGKPFGTGLGLAISKKIVEHLGGGIGLDTAIGGGAVFTVSLPFRTAGDII